MDDIRVGYRVTTPQGKDGTVVSLKLTGAGTLAGVQLDDGKIKHCYVARLRAAKTGANTTYVDLPAKVAP